MTTNDYLIFLPAAVSFSVAFAFGVPWVARRLTSWLSER